MLSQFTHFVYFKDIKEHYRLEFNLASELEENTAGTL